MTKRQDDVTIREPSSLPRSHLLHTEPAGTAPPDAFGPFRVLHQIGAGTLGPVFRAYDAERERLVAVKLFTLDIAPDAAHRLAAAFERLSAAELWHPALVLPVTVGVAGVNAFLATDYVAADSLDAVVRERGVMAPIDAIRMAHDIGGALDV